MGLKAGENFTTIARRIDSDRATVSREAKARRVPVHNSKGNNCIDGCDRFQEDFCTRYENPPYVCSACPYQQFSGC